MGICGSPETPNWGCLTPYVGLSSHPLPCSVSLDLCPCHRSCSPVCFSFSYTNSGSCCFSQWPTLTGPADGSPLRLWSGHAGILPTTDPSFLFLTVLPPLQHVNESQGHHSFKPRTWLSTPLPQQPGSHSQLTHSQKVFYSHGFLYC